MAILKGADGMRRRIVAMLAIAAALAGCGGPRVFLHPEADLSYYERVGVIPFLSAAGDQAAALAATGCFTTELLIERTYEVAEPGDFMIQSARAAGGTDVLRTQPLNAEQIRALADSTKVQAVFEGLVVDHEMVRVGQGSYPLVSVEVRMIDAETGKLLWMGSRTRRGGPGLPILGWGETPTLSELTQKVCADIARRVPR
jgi:hypothetical protein